MGSTPKTTILGKLAYQKPVGVSYLGTPIIDNVVFPAGVWIDLEGERVEFSQLKIDNAQLTVTRATNEVKSQISGKDGTIKEYINKDDYIISLEGSFSAVFGGLPFEQFVSWGEVEAVPEAVLIESKFLNTMFGIEYVVISSFSLNNGGSNNDFPLSIQMESDDPELYNWFSNQLASTTSVGEEDIYADADSDSIRREILGI